MIRVIEKSISLDELRDIAKEPFGDMVKAVVDIKKGIMAVGASMHADEEAELLARGSSQHDLWGINLYPEKDETSWLEFDSMINLRPGQGNRSRGVENPEMQQQIRSIVQKLIMKSS